MKKIKLYETLNSVLDMQIKESQDNLMHLEGVFGVCGVLNNNDRIYTRENYQEMIEALQDKIEKHALLGEMEHSYSMNVNLQQVSHRIDSVTIDEDGVVRGSLTILNTPNGQIARSIIEAGSPLYVSSKAVGTIDENKVVTLTKLFGWDLVGSPGFSEAEVNLKENECFESLNDNMVIISEEDEDEEKPEDEKEPENNEEPKDEEPKKDEDEDEEPKQDEPEDEEPKDDEQKDEEPKDDEDEDEKKVKESYIEYLDSLIEEIKTW